MVLHFYGHSFFTLTLSDGTVIATDPYGDFYEYPRRLLRADFCTISHHHHDHDGLQYLSGSPVVLDTPGPHPAGDHLTITGIPSWHDDAEGAKRGHNLIFLIEADGLRIAHLGDLGHPLTEAQRVQIGRPDILLLPVGGYYTIDAAQAVMVLEQLQPRVFIPMHYRTRANPGMPIAGLSAFLRLLSQSPEPMTLCRITREDLSERSGLLVMTTPEGL